jgi:dTDP-4-amino-4,6-dideoxygalactose transaminase
LDRNFILTKLRKNGIQCGIYYPTPVHKLITFQTDDNLPVAEKISKECFSIPVHPKLKKSQLAKIVKTLNLIASGKI